jgi:superfamily II DNA/RNA helicase
MLLPLALTLTLTLGWTSAPHGRSFQTSNLHKRGPSSLCMSAEEDAMGLNELQTLLRNAALKEDFMEANRLSELLIYRMAGDHPPTTDAELKSRRLRMSWTGLGAAPWLVDRLDALNFTFPTTIQINSMEAVNAILGSTDEMLEKTTLEQRYEMNDKDMGIVVSGTTGSGKTISYLVPLLSTLSDSLFTRQRVRVGAEERLVGDKTDELISRVMAVTSPELRSTSRKQTRQGGIATGAAMSSLGTSGTDVKSPLALIVVPTRELGVQIAMLLYRLVGGSIKRTSTQMDSGKANMFKYKGPKGVKIGCVLDEDESSFGLKLQTDVAVTTPEFLGKLIADGDVDPSKLRVVVYDEADLALEETKPADLKALFEDDADERQYTRLTFLVGASVTESLGSLAVRSRVLPEGKSYIATATSFAQLNPSRSLGLSDESNEALIKSSKSASASLKDLSVCMDPGLVHQRAIAPHNTGLLTLTRLLRQELKEYEEAVAAGSREDGIQRPRVVVFFPTEEEARAAIAPLRDAVWGDHKVCVLLPKTGVNPLQMMDDFKNNETSVMIATANSVRGLDFPALTSVYTLYLPMDDPREYVHLAGRVGRVGQMGSVQGAGGRVISILKGVEAEKMEGLAKELNFKFTDIAPIQEVVWARTEDGEVDIENADIEKMRQLLEDTMNLMGDAVEKTVDFDSIDRSQLDLDDDDEDDEDDSS